MIIENSESFGKLIGLLIQKNCNKISIHLINEKINKTIKFGIYKPFSRTEYRIRCYGPTIKKILIFKIIVIIKFKFHL